MTNEEAKQLLVNPCENLAIEIKRWLSLKDIAHKAKIIKGCIALYNNNGGFFIIGFDNNGNPDSDVPQGNLRELYHPDAIQDLISRHASFPFEVKISFPERNKQIYPVIQIPGGIETPVGVKKELKENDNIYLRADRVYVRTLTSNNTISSAPAKHSDWERLVKICFDNREADIARFIKRHLSSLAPQSIKSLAALLESEDNKIGSSLIEFQKESKTRFEYYKGNKLKEDNKNGFIDFSFCFSEELKDFSANMSFLNVISANNPHLTGWPLWNVFTREEIKPKVFDNCWESFIKTEVCSMEHIDFWKISPKGYFFHRRILEEDCHESIKPNTILFFDIIAHRITEAMVSAIKYAEAFKMKDKLLFSINVFGLKGRCLSCFSPKRMWRGTNHSIEENYSSEILSIPVDTPLNNIGEYVYQITKNLFSLFDGYEIEKNIIESIADETISRR